MINKKDPSRETRILTTFSKLIAHYGYDKTTMDDLAREAGVSKGALYLHWKSKTEMLDALLIHEMTRLLDDLTSRIEADPDGGTIAKMYQHALLALKDNPLMSALYTRDSRILGDYISRSGSDRYTERFLFGQTFVKQLQDAGLIRSDLSAEVIAYLMSVISFGFIGIETIIPASSAPSIEDVARGIAAVTQTGFAGENGESKTGKQALFLLIDQIKEQYRKIGGNEK